MIRRFSFAVLLLLIARVSSAEFPPRFQDLQALFYETRLHLFAIVQEMAKDDLWQLVPHYVDGSFDEPHTPELTSIQIAKYRDLLELVPYVSYVDKVDDWTGFSAGSASTDRLQFIFEFKHTTRPERPPDCNESLIGGTKGNCSLDLGDDWTLWVIWVEPSSDAG